MKQVLLLILISSFATVFGQNDEFNTADLRRIALVMEFEFTKNLKNFSEDQLMKFYTSIEADRGLIKQININSWAICENSNIDNFDIYNYYYKDISRTAYENSCKKLNALMLLDGTITQLK